MHDYLQNSHVDTDYITGLAADVCVRYAALDALEPGYVVYLVKDTTKAVGGKKAPLNTFQDLEGKEVIAITSKEITDLR